MAVYLGLDLGQVKDFSALSVLEKVWPEQPADEQVKVKPFYNVRYLDRYPLGTKYPAIVDAVKTFMGHPQLRGAVLIIDATGVGRPVVDMFIAARMKPYAITITGSGQPHEVEERWWNVAKRDLVSTTQVLIQGQRLRLGERINMADMIRSELDAFTVKITAASNDTYEAWRENTHDDLVLSVAMAAWFAEHGPRSSLAGVGLVQGSVKVRQPS